MSRRAALKDDPVPYRFHELDAKAEPLDDERCAIIDAALDRALYLSRKRGVRIVVSDRSSSPARVRGYTEWRDKPSRWVWIWVMACPAKCSGGTFASWSGAVTCVKCEGVGWVEDTGQR